MRTPIGRYGGALSEVRPDDLAALVIREAVERARDSRVALVSSGVVTAVPLLLFNSAARRLPLSVLGMLQYIAPTMQFLIGTLVFGEHMPPARWIGFGLVWVALVGVRWRGRRWWCVPGVGC